MFKILESIRLIMLVPGGSYLYGTNTINSDQDYKGIYLPTRKQVLLHDVPKTFSYNTKKDGTKNSSEDVELIVFSLYYYIELLLQGEMAALDILHAPRTYNIEGEWDIWENIRKYRSKAYTKNVKGWLQYAQKQAAKYGIKGSRINILETLIELFSNIGDTIRLGDILDTIPDLEFTKKVEGNTNLERKLFIDGREFIGTTPIKYIKEFLYKHRQDFGIRAELAAKNLGIDWKAISHAFRAYYQFKHILLDGDYEYPLEEANYLKQIKSGELDFNIVLPELETLANEVDVLVDKSELPKTIDKEFWNEVVLDIIEGYVL